MVEDRPAAARAALRCWSAAALASAAAEASEGGDGEGGGDGGLETCGEENKELILTLLQHKHYGGPR